MPDEPTRPPDIGLYWALAATGVEMVVPIVVGAFLDSYLSWTPWATLAGVVLGLASALIHMTFLLRRLERRPPRQPRDEP